MEHYITAFSRIYDFRAFVNGRLIYYQENIATFADFIKTVFRQEKIAYPKFFKMDSMSKLGFLASELVLKERPVEGYDAALTGVVFANSGASLDTDMAHQETIRDRSAYFPSPSVFVYTLPNIVIGEVCIRHRIKGENAFLVAESPAGGLLHDYVAELFRSGRLEACLVGWVEVVGESFDAMVALVEPAGRVSGSGTPGFRPIRFTRENFEMLMQINR